VYHDYGGKAEVYSRVHHMLVSAWGNRWRKVQLIMFTIHLDDSGTSPSQHVAIATALIIPALQLVRMEREWNNVKIKEEFTDFSMSEFVARNPKSEFANWDDAKRLRVYQRIRQISKKYGLRSFSVAINKVDYDELIPDIIRNVIGKYHYTWAIHHTLSFIDGWRGSDGKRPPCEYVFHWMQGESRTEVESAMKRAEESAIEDGRAGDYSNYSFRKSKNVPGLECIDAISWVCYQYALYAIRDKPPHEFATVGWQDFGGHVDGGWLKAVTITRASLQDWINRALSDQVSLDWLTMMEERRVVKAKSANHK
jgi:hypothetical protein